MTGGTWAGTGGRFDMFYPGYGDPNDSVNVLASSRTGHLGELNLRSVSPLFTVGLRHDAIGQRSAGQRPVDPAAWVHQGRSRRHGVNDSNNTYTGPTTINNGTLQLGDGTLGMTPR